MTRDFNELSSNAQRRVIMQALKSLLKGKSLQEALKSSEARDLALFIECGVIGPHTKEVIALS